MGKLHSKIKTIIVIDPRKNDKLFGAIHDHVHSDINKYVKYKKNWCTVTVAPTIEHHGGHSRSLQTRGETRCPGGVNVSCLASRTRNEYPRHNESVYKEAWHGMWTDTI